MHESLFEEAYARLNPEQRKAVDTIEGPVMVIAGPGTGKTQILTLRIAQILRKTQIGPENILALTFTESGARAMRERLAQYIGSVAYQVGIHTFHEFAGMLIRTYPDAYERAVGGVPMSDLEQVDLITRILEMSEIRLLRPSGNPEFYVKPIRSALSLMKREYITPDRFSEMVQDEEEKLAHIPKIHEKGAHKGKTRGEYIDAEKRLKKHKELLFVYRAYEAALKDTHTFDYDDMIFETVEALTHHEDMLRSLQEQYQYILADEHQDVNGSQNKILELIASFHERPNIFVVGDEKQSIYRFQGASLENFLYFEEKFPHAETIALTKNYRSVQRILDYAHELIAVESGPLALLRVPLSAERSDEGVIERRVVSHEAVEHELIKEQIQGLLKEGVPPEEIAVIVRTNREVEDLASYFRSAGIPTEASADGDILAHPITTQVRTLLTAMAHPHDERPLFEILSSGYLGITPENIVRIMRTRSYDTPLQKILDNEALLTSCGVSQVEAVRSIPRILEHARIRGGTESPHRTLAYVLEAFGFVAHMLTVSPYDGGRVIRRLYDEVEELVRSGKAKTLRDVEALLTLYVNHGLSLTAPYIRAGSHAVEVMTAHKAKGLEFLHVFMPHLIDSRWGGKVRAEYFHIPVATRLKEEDFESEDDERKLLYVGLTRAKVGLYLSSAETSGEGRSLLPTRLLTDIGETHVVAIDTSEDEARFIPTEIHIEENSTSRINPEFLRETLKTRGLSATALNNYLSDPWNYFYRNVLRIPEVQAESAQFGTALHDTLRSIMKHRREQGSLPKVHELKIYLERELGKMPLAVEEYTRLHERALSALKGYMEHLEGTLPHETREEYKIQVRFQTGNPDFPEVLLTGMLDRMDFDATGRLLRVVDYKSGKPKTRGQIEGTTKDSNGEYKRQLTFYALLLMEQDDERFHTREGVLSFIEPDERGVIHEEAYTITDEDITALKQDIVRVVSEIAGGTFLTQPCNEEHSPYCELARTFIG